jgi:polar amino acid transport system substrate-binding protein
MLRVLVAAAALVCSGCTVEHDASGNAFVPHSRGTLTVATAYLPSSGFWESGRGGLEARLADALAHRLGLNGVSVVQVPFGRIVAGRLRGADLALSQLTPTERRERVLDFTTPYLSAPPAVLALRRVDVRDVAGLQKLRWAVSRTSALTPIVRSTIRPNEPPLVVADRTAALRVLRAGGADAVLLDLPVALGIERDEPATFRVVGQLPGAAGLAAALPNASPNTEIVDSAIRHLQADGTIERLVKRWLGQDEQDVPLIRTEG